MAAVALTRNGKAKSPAGLRILVTKLDGIGDFALALPALRAFVEANPGVEMDFVISSFNQGWKDLVPWIRKFYTIDFRSFRPYEPRRMSRSTLVRRILTLTWEMRRARYDAAIDLRAGAEDGHGKWILWLSGAPVRLGAPGVGSWALTQTLPQTAIHQSDVILDRLRVWEPGLEKASRDLVSVSRKRPASAAPHVILHPGVAGPERRWLMPYWIELARLMKQSGMPLTFEFLGGPEDKARLAEIAAAAGLGPDQTRVSGTLREMVQILADADLLVGLNSSAAHLAYLVGTPVITIFSAANDPAAWAALGNNTVLFTPIECSPCRLPHCKWETHRCMEAISPAAVFSTLKQKLLALGF